MWAGGKMTWDSSNPLLVGSKTYSKGSVAGVTLKGVEKGKPKLFLTQNIHYEMDAMKGKSSLVEERAHVYFEVKDEHEGSKPPPKRKWHNYIRSCSLLMHFPCRQPFKEYRLP
jgi:sphingosine kinase